MRKRKAHRLHGRKCLLHLHNKWRRKPFHDPSKQNYLLRRIISFTDVCLCPEVAFSYQAWHFWRKPRLLIRQPYTFLPTTSALSLTTLSIKPSGTSQRMRDSPSTPFDCLIIFYRVKTRRHGRRHACLQLYTTTSSEDLHVVYRMQAEEAKGTNHSNCIWMNPWLTKVKCNQAKDRPCNNCSRRYPPVKCTYQNSRSAPVYLNRWGLNWYRADSPPHPSDRDIDTRDSNLGSQHTEMAGPVHAQTSQPTINNFSERLASDDISQTPHSATLSTPDYRQYQTDNSIRNMHYMPTTSGGGNYTTASYLQNQTNWSTTGVTTYGYYPTPEQQATDWLSANGDPIAFGGVASDYYYVLDLSDQAPPRLWL